MDRLLSTLLISVLLLTGCSADDDPADAGSTAQPVAEELDTPQNTCRALFNEDEGSLHKTVTSWLLNVSSLDKNTATEAEELSGKLAAVASTAEEELATPITRMRAPLDEFVHAWDINGSWSFDGAKHKTAFEETIDVCARYFPVESIAPTPEPTALPMTGDFAADAIAAGLDPSLVGVYEAVDLIYCDHPVNGAVSEREYALDVAKYRNDGAADDVLRLVVQYNCPEQMEALEAAFTRLDD